MTAELERTQRDLDRAHQHAREERPEGMDAFIAAVSKVDIPSFWEADPVLWFRQCESAFRRANTTSSGVKFDHIVGKLPNAVSLSCRSLLLSINFEDKDAYERLKAHLCKNFGKSKRQMGYALDSPGLGDPRPTQLLQDLRALLPVGETEGTLFQCIFLKRLPAAMSDAILAANLEDIEAMAEMADRLFDRPSAAVAAAIQPCCTHVSAIDSQQRKFNRSGRSPERSHSLQSEERPPPADEAAVAAAAAPGPERQVFANSWSRTDPNLNGCRRRKILGVTSTSFSVATQQLACQVAPIRKTRQPP
jgi:hypothetical protein